MLRDGAFRRVPCETNTVRGHHLVSGIHDGCFISTTESYEIAIRFATSEGHTNGFVYILDESRFSELDIVAQRLPDPHYPEEEEVSIRATDGGESPQSVIVEIRKVQACEYKVCPSRD